MQTRGRRGKKERSTHSQRKKERGGEKLPEYVTELICKGEETPEQRALLILDIEAQNYAYYTLFGEQPFIKYKVGGKIYDEILTKQELLIKLLGMIKVLNLNKETEKGRENVRQLKRIKELIENPEKELRKKQESSNKSSGIREEVEKLGDEEILIIEGNKEQGLVYEKKEFEIQME